MCCYELLEILKRQSLVSLCIVPPTAVVVCLSSPYSGHISHRLWPNMSLHLPPDKNSLFLQ